LRFYPNIVSWNQNLQERALMPDTHETRGKRAKKAREQQGATKEVLRARPVKGTIDHAALSKEFMARFPKIRAALAK
jgi:hypothetical protein